MLEVIRATAYLTPLREGGSLPGIVEGDDLGTYVVKFRGAGQGLKVLVAEVIVGELARALGIATPELKAIRVDAPIAQYERDFEVQALLDASLGLNLAVDYLPGSLGFDGSSFTPPEDLAARILWLDALVANVDRTWRNTNLLIWHKNLWAIDHGASLYFHYTWDSGRASPEKFAAQAYDTSHHVLAARAARSAELGPDLTAILDPATLRRILDLVPDEWLEPTDAWPTPDRVRQSYVDFLLARLGNPAVWQPGGVQ